MLMDDKTYPYVMVTTGENYPRIVMARRMKKDVTNILDLLQVAGQ